MAKMTEDIYWLESDQRIGWTLLRQKIVELLKNKWPEVHSLSFESGVKGYFFVGNDVFHFEICPNRIDFSVITHTEEEAITLCKKFKEVMKILK